MTLQASASAYRGHPFTKRILFTIPHPWKLQLTLPLSVTTLQLLFISLRENSLFQADQPLLPPNETIDRFSYGESKL